MSIVHIPWSDNSNEEISIDFTNLINGTGEVVITSPKNTTANIRVKEIPIKVKNLLNPNTLQPSDKSPLVTLTIVQDPSDLVLAYFTTDDGEPVVSDLNGDKAAYKSKR